MPALVLLGILIGATQAHWRAWFSPDPPSAATRLAVSPDCDPVGAFCTARSTQLTIGLGLEGDVEPLRVFTLVAKLAGDAADGVDAVAVRFEMPGMAMGINRFALTRDADGFWRGQAMVPICTTARRDWVASVEVAGERRFVADFALRMGP
jgi:hypothetical protein